MGVFLDSRRTDILCVGNAIVDVYGSFPGPLPERGARHVGSRKIAALLASLGDPVYSAGGGAANAAKIAGLLGFQAGFAGTVGRGPSGKGDELARLFEAELQSASVRTFLSRGSGPTGCCVILSEAGASGGGRAGGSRGSAAISACPGAALELRAGDIPDFAIREAGVLLLDGYLLPRPGLVEPLLQKAREAGIPAALDAGAGFIARSFGKKILKYLREIPLLLFMNEEEERAFTKTAGSSPAQLTGSEPLPLIAVKRGAKGATVFSGGRIINVETEARVPVESTGAGDAFCGAFLCAWIRNKTPEECAALANKAAALVLGIPGTAVNGPLKKAFAALGETLRGPA
jgi:sugar/nucleoside kinase (ribokinase family)